MFSRQPLMEAKSLKKGSLLTFFVLLFGLSIPCWTLGAIYDVDIFPGFKLFQLPLAMPMVAALILVYLENGRRGLVNLLKRTYDFRNIKPEIWYLPILFLFPSIAFLNYLMVRASGASIPSPHLSVITFLGYSTVFFMTYAEEIGLTGYAVDRMQQRYSAVTAGLLLGVVWAVYHIPGFILSGYYLTGWIFWHAIYTIASRVLFVWIYNNAGQSLFSMALLHWSFGLFWSLWPQDNLQRAVPFYDPYICAVVAVLYVAIVIWLWGAETLRDFRFSDNLKHQ